MLCRESKKTWIGRCTLNSWRWWCLGTGQGTEGILSETEWDWKGNRRNLDISEASMIKKPVHLFLLAGEHRVLAVFVVVSELTNFSFKLKREIVSWKSPVLESNLLQSACCTPHPPRVLGGWPPLWQGQHEECVCRQTPEQDGHLSLISFWGQSSHESLMWFMILKGGTSS